MSVHAQTVFPRPAWDWLYNFDTTFYNSITDKENDAYTRGGNNTVANWQPLFTNIANALTSWKNTSRQSAISDHISLFYSYILLNNMFGTDGSQMSNGAASSIFTCNGFFAATKSRAVTYYDDIVIGSPNSSVKIAADVTSINGGIAAETSAMSSFKSIVMSVTSAHMNKTLFQDILPTNPYPGKAWLANKVFIDYGFKGIYQGLNVGNLVLPPGV